MNRIRLLDPKVANQIAAGEVVERPASVVKELVENSLDAESRFISIEVQGGGQELLRVRDDGTGMSRDDLVLSVARHATSKISKIEDLETSFSLGFRGEALAAIAAVGDFSIQSREAGAAHGYRLTVQYGRAGEPQGCAMNPGTEVTVEHLFQQLPARLKSLKTPAREWAAIHQLVQHLAVGFAEVQFRLSSEKRVWLQTTGRGDAEEAILSVWGRDIHRDLISVGYRSERGVAIRGYILPAHIHRGTRHAQSLFVNRRWVSNWVLRNALEEAFRPNIPDRRYPLYWIWIETTPGEVDPNAHPTKAEVRIEQERRLASLLYRTVLDALTERSGSAVLVPETFKPEDPETRQATFSYEPSPNDFPFGQEASVLHQEFRDLVPLAQWAQKYIVAQGPDGLYLIDQHAAHERIYYEEFRRMGQDVTMSQALLIPWTRTLTPGEWATYREHQDVLQQVGFQCEEVGGHTILVRAIPQGFHEQHPDPGVLNAVLQSLEGNNTSQSHHPIAWVENHRYAMAACKAAIKAYRAMSMIEMQHLLDQMARVEDPRGCPHGRPTLLQLRLEEVDRRFGRRG